MAFEGPILIGGQGFFAWFDVQIEDDGGSRVKPGPGGGLKT